MGEIFEIRKRIEEEITKQKLDEFYTKGQISLSAGFLIGLINEDTPDDPNEIEILKNATRKVLNIVI